MLRDIKAYTKASSTCLHICQVWHRPHGMMEPLPQPRSPWTNILIDFIVGLPESPRRPRGKRYNVILIVLNQYTQIVQYFKCYNIIDTKGLVDIIAQKLALQGAGILLSIVSNREPNFTSKFGAVFCHNLSIEWRLSTAYHP